MLIRRATVAAAALVGAISASVAPAQERGGPADAILGNLDGLIDNYAMLLVRKYDLDDRQTDYTKQLLRARTKDFFSRHESEVRELMDQLFSARAGTNLTQEDLMNWGRRVSPLFEEAKHVIVESNDQWRQVLNEEQRRIHDKDLALMAESFESTGYQLDRIVTGEMTIEEFRNPMRLTRPARPSSPAPAAPQVVAGEPVPHVRVPATVPQQPPPAQPGQVEEDGGAVAIPPGQQPPVVRPRPQPPSQPPAARPPTPQPQPPGSRGEPARPASDKDFAGKWEQYVRSFIARYELDEGQSQKAMTYLKDCVTQGERYMQTRQDQIDKLDQEIANLAKSQAKDRAAQAARFAEQRKKLLDPLDRIFEQQLKPRLDRLPTRAQRAAAEKADKKPADAKPKAGPAAPTAPKGDDE